MAAVGWRSGLSALVARSRNGTAESVIDDLALGLAGLLGRIGEGVHR